MGWNYQYTYETMPACKEQADGEPSIADPAWRQRSPGTFFPEHSFL